MKKYFPVLTIAVAVALAWWLLSRGKKRADAIRAERNAELESIWTDAASQRSDLMYPY